MNQNTKRIWFLSFLRQKTAVMFEVIHGLPVQVGHRETIGDITVDIGKLHLRKALLFDRKFLARHIAVLKTHLADTVTLYRHFLVPAVDAVTLLRFIHTTDDLANLLFDSPLSIVEIQFALFQADLLAAYLVLARPQSRSG